MCGETPSDRQNPVFRRMCKKIDIFLQNCALFIPFSFRKDAKRIKEADSMAKSLYSLILSDEVVSRIDRLATRQGMNRSQLVNRILAEYCSLVTPEKRIESVLDAVTRLMDGDGELAPFFTPNQPAMFFKTSLEYRYRPTVRYDLRLRPQPENGSVGELTVTFRTTSEELLTLADRYFRLRIDAETRASPEDPPAFTVSPGRLTRSIAAPPEGTDPEVFAERISEYVRRFDRDMKAFIKSQSGVV